MLAAGGELGPWGHPGASNWGDWNPGFSCGAD